MCTCGKHTGKNFAMYVATSKLYKCMCSQSLKQLINKQASTLLCCLTYKYGVHKLDNIMEWVHYTVQFQTFMAKNFRDFLNSVPKYIFRDKTFIKS